MMAGGAAHFVTPLTYQRIVPRPMGHAGFLVAASGVVELAAGLLLVVPRTRRLGAWLTFAVLLAVWPANLQMALDGGLPGARFPAGSPLVAWARLPLQVPLLAWAWWCATPRPPMSSSAWHRRVAHRLNLCTEGERCGS